MPEPRILLTGLAFGESPRWHEGRLWFCNWGTEIVSLDLDGNSEVEVRVPTTTLPYSVDWRSHARGVAIELDRGCFACMLGGADRRTLFMMAAEWRGMENMISEARSGQVLIAEAPAPGAGWP
jgi:sugar lactone lactonase YvrE